MAIERLFTFKDGETPLSYDPGDPDTYKQFVHALITDARDYENSVLAPKRDEAQKYYYGMMPALAGSGYSDTLIVEDPNATFEEILGPTEGPSRSSFISTDVRDAILMMLPSLVRIFACIRENVVLPGAAIAARRGDGRNRRPTMSTTLLSGRTTRGSSRCTAPSRTR